jgi:hypothetical protein
MRSHAAGRNPSGKFDFRRFFRILAKQPQMSAAADVTLIQHLSAAEKEQYAAHLHKPSLSHRFLYKGQIPFYWPDS